MLGRAAAVMMLFAAACSSARRGAEGVDFAAVPAGAETLSLAGEPLHRLPLKPDDASRRDDLIANKRKICEDCPELPLTFVWYGRALGTVHRYRDAVSVFTRGLERTPDNVQLLRFRGHRFITLRRFGDALRDLERAAEFADKESDAPEEDAMPAPGKAPTGTIHHNVYYHLGLAHYLQRNFGDAAAAFRRSLDLAKTPEAQSGATFWLAAALLRAQRGDEATRALGRIESKWTLSEGRAYRDLCLVFRGDLKPEELLARTPRDPDGYDFPTIGNGVAIHYFATGRAAEAAALWADVARHPFWPAFGRIAAEVETAPRK